MNQSHSSNVHLVSDDDMDQDRVSIQHDNPQIPQIIPPSDGMLSNAFSPQKRQPYCTLELLERAIMVYMHYHRNDCVLLSNLAQVIQTSHRCTESQFKWVLVQFYIQGIESQVPLPVLPSRHCCQRHILQVHSMMAMWSLHQDTRGFTWKYYKSVFVTFISDMALDLLILSQ